MLAVATRLSAQQPTAIHHESRTLPLQPTRTVKFTTDEGTWMSLDVSPDGQTIVFDLLGDLYTIQITGGKATRITGGMAVDRYPRFSPDGRQILFVSDRDGASNLWRINRDGTVPSPITASDDADYVSPEWLPDGSGVVVTRSPGELWLYHLGGDSGSAVPTHGGSYAPRLFVGAAFGADPTHLFMSASMGRDFSQGGWEIAELDRNTGLIRPLTDASFAAFRPALSPDGRYLAYVSRRDTSDLLVLRDLSTGVERVIADEVQDDLLWAFRDLRDMFPGYSFTPDSKALVLTTGGKLWRIAIPSGVKSPIPFVADVEQQLGPLSKFDYTIDDSLLTVRQIRYPRLSPEGNRLAFSALGRIWVMDLPNGVPRRLTADSLVEDQPAWSPDGRYIAYVTWDERRGGHIYRMPSAGAGQALELTREDGFYSRLRYSPDGRHLVAVRGPSERQGRRTPQTEVNGWELCVLPDSGGQTRPIAPVFANPFGFNASMYGSPHFATGTDGVTRLYVHDLHDGLVSMDLDGGNRRSVAQVFNIRRPSIDIPTREALLSPDGRQLLLLTYEGIYLAPAPTDTTRPDTIAVWHHVVTSGAGIREVVMPGGDFMDWRQDGRAFYYSVGHTLFIYDLDQAAVVGKSYRPARTDVIVRVPRDRPKGTLVLRGGRLVTMRGDEVIENGDLLIGGNRIVALGRRGTVTIPQGTRVVDVTGKTVLPGFVDIHAHLVVNEVIPDFQPYYQLAYLAYGVTTVRDPQTETLEALGYQDLEAAGLLLGPRHLSTGVGIFGSLYGIRSLDDARAIISRYSESYGTQTIKEYNSGNRRIRQWVAMAAYGSRLTPTTHNTIGNGLAMVLDGYAGVEHANAFPYPIFSDLARFLAASGTTFTPTIFAFSGNYFYTGYPIHDEPKLRRFLPHGVLDDWVNRTDFFPDGERRFVRYAAGAARIVAAGGRVGMGGHGEIPALGSHFDLWAMALGGMPMRDVLRVGTQFGADAIGLGKELGSLEVGKLADLQVLDRNPLRNIRNTNSVRYVMKNGRLYDASTLDELWPRQRALPPPWWWERDPAMGRP